MKFDFYDSNGKWIDACETDQLVRMTALLTLRFGEVKVVQRKPAVETTKELSFCEWLFTV